MSDIEDRTHQGTSARPVPGNLCAGQKCFDMMRKKLLGMSIKVRFESYLDVTVGVGLILAFHDILGVK